MKLTNRVLALLAAIFLLPLAALAEDFQADTDYRVLQAPVATSAPEGKVEVVELFWYGCPHCYALEPALEQWLQKKPENVHFVRVPAVFGKGWELDARVYYAAEAMGVLDKIHRPYFDEIHSKKRNRPKSKEEVAEFFATLGVDKDAFLKTFDSFAVETKLRRSQELVKRYGADGVPAMIINGKYETNNPLAKDSGRLFQIVDFLVQKESQSG
ncbi:MAG TPA: thiol:disulfide interchange protein DsbA/DsbL [Candidatus Competibacteraceae bacterium]|nr:thiol:disulfide interchange protein DsbA/DsbL [Candidatus Competibacteraceae bacterium]